MSLLGSLRQLAIAALSAIAVVGCAVAQPPTALPATRPAAAATPSAAPTATAAPRYADTLRVAWSDDPRKNFRGLYVPTGSPSINFGSIVYSSLYRLDARYEPVPDLADGSCLPTGDGLVIRCRLVATTFQDGTPVTADDVAYVYGLFMLPGDDKNTVWCGWPVPCTLKEVRVVDTRTVDFVLSSVDPTFLSVGLASVPVFSRRDVETKYAAFDAATKGLSAKDVQTAVDAFNSLAADHPDGCAAQVAQADTLLARLGAHLYREDHRSANGSFDPCGYLLAAADELQFVAWALDASGPYAVVQALIFFSTFSPLTGTGPYRYVSQTADLVHFEAFAGYHGGPAATASLDFVRPKVDGSDVEAGAVDVAQSLTFSGGGMGASFTATAGAHGVRIATPPQAGYYGLTFNVRQGLLFADANLRLALQRCITLPVDVDAVTGGTGTPVYGPVLPGSWADEPNLPKPDRDVVAARALIEASGWTAGPDGVYTKAGRRLAADILVRSSSRDRVAMAGLIAYQARDCGMSLSTRPLDFATQLTPMVHHYPHLIPGTTQPFDIYLAGWMNAADPSSGLGVFVSSAITTKEHPDGVNYPNFGGFSDPTVDRLVVAGGATYDQAQRTAAYRQAQTEIAAKQPVLFLWALNNFDAVRTAVATSAGRLDLSPPNWAWQPERLAVQLTP